jgi:flagellar hook-associated protein 1 FlgK
MSLSAVLSIGKQGVTAQQRAISVTSNNIANVNTPGYTRQRPVFESVTPTYMPEGFGVGGGVGVDTIERIADRYLDSQLLRERHALAFDEGMDTGLARLEGIFAELAGTGIGGRLSEFFKSLSYLATHPSDPTVRTQVIQNAISLTDLIHDTDRRLAQLQTDANQKIETIVDEINELASEIARANREIFVKEGAGAVASELRDHRQALLGQLAEKIDFTTFERDDGQIALFVAGGFFLVDSDLAASLEVRTGAGPTGAFFDIYQNVDGSIAGPITGLIRSGELGAELALRDDRVPAYRQQLDEFAFTLARRVNNVHLGGFGLADDQRRRFFVDPTGAPDPAGPDLTSIGGAASTIGINAELLANPDHLAAGATSLALGAGASSGDNQNALALAAVETVQTPMFRIIDPPLGPATGNPRTLGEFWDSLLGGLGSEMQATHRSARQAELILAELENRRGALSGVSIDEEVANLIRFEHAYQASARVIQSASDMLDMLFSI